MKGAKIDGWLIYDFRGNNPVMGQVAPGKRSTTRRNMLWIPANAGEQPRFLVHHIDLGQFKRVEHGVDVYLTWQELRAWVGERLKGCAAVAMEYAPGGGLPVVGIVDAGTVELVRECAPQARVVSSANLVQVSVAVWSAEAAASHDRASAHCARIMKGVFGYIRDAHAAGRGVNEYQAQRWILDEFAKAGLETADAPIVAVNGHAGDPHFEVSHTDPTAIVRGDWILVDLWAREPGDHNIFSDITWVGYAGERVPQRHMDVFRAVRSGRNASVALVKARWASGMKVQGWEVDDAAYQEIVKAGFKDGIKHRTGHSLSAGPKVHGVGVNIDNLETHDTRELLPGVGFTIEPGAYYADLGVRMEVNMYMDPAQGPRVTSCWQDEPEMV
jgi:Xaa-Pro dipeptidase